MAGVLTFAFVALLTPRAVVACSCAGGLSVAEYVRTAPGAALVVGQVTRDRADGSYDFTVERWYGGKDQRPTVVLQSALQNGAFNTCGMEFTVGQRLLFLAEPGEDGRYAPGICGLSADPNTPGGADIERQAGELLGTAFVPIAEPSEPPPAATPTGGGPDIAVVAAGIAGAVLALFGGVVLLGRRHHSRAG